jgi:aminoglycoside phosphotransferase (APT) family kinase protein
MLAPPGRLGVCRVRRSKFKPGHKLTAWLDVQVGPGGAVRPVAVSWSASGARGTDADAAATAEAAARGLLAPFRSLSAEGAETRIEVAPLDRAYPALVRLSDPDYVAGRVDGPGRPEVVTVRYRPGQRHVLRYQPGGGRGPALFAKLYGDASARRRSDVAHAMADLLAGGPCLGARPAACLDDDDAVLFAEVGGVPLSALLRRPGTRASEALEAAGAVLRRIHDAPEVVAGVDCRDLRVELAEVDRTSATMRQLLPATGRVVGDVLARAEASLASLPAEPATLVHGDAKADHFLVGAASMTLIDFDKCALADPALDLAKMLADLRWWLVARPLDLDGAQRRFLAGYGAASARVARARALESLLLVKLIAHRVPVHRLHWAERTEALVAHAAGLFERAA